MISRELAHIASVFLGAIFRYERARAVHTRCNGCAADFTERSCERHDAACRHGYLTSASMLCLVPSVTGEQLYRSPLHRLAISPINLSANSRYGALINRSRVPCLDRRKIGFARLVTSTGVPTMSLKEIRC